MYPTPDGLIELVLPAQPEWVRDALCAQTDPDLFFPDKGGTTKPAKQICARCPVAEQCLADALERHDRYGIWGGLSERDRRRIINNRRKEGKPA